MRIIPEYENNWIKVIKICCQLFELYYDLNEPAADFLPFRLMAAILLRFYNFIELVKNY